LVRVRSAWASLAGKRYRGLRRRYELNTEFQLTASVPGSTIPTCFPSTRTEDQAPGTHSAPREGPENESGSDIPELLSLHPNPSDAPSREREEKGPSYRDRTRHSPRKCRVVENAVFETPLSRTNRSSSPLSQLSSFFIVPNLATLLEFFGGE